MTTDLHTFAAPYALDALEPLERARFEGHLEGCPTCQAELEGFTATATRLGEALSDAPPADLRSRILAQAVETPQERPARPVPGRLRQLAPRLVMAAAMLVGIVGGVGFVIEHDRAGEVRDRTAAMEAVLGAADAKTVTQRFDEGGTVRMVMSARQDSAVVVARDLPKLSADRVYQVWMIAGVTPSSKGVFARSGSMVMDDVTEADRIAVTVEPRGGSTRPTTVPVVDIKL